MTESVMVRYTGAVPGADANTYPIFSSVTAFPGCNMAQNTGLKRLFVTFDNPQSATLKFYRCNDGIGGNTTARGTNWVQVGGDFAITASATDVATFDGLIEGFPDFKLDLVNGGAAQTGWTVTIALTGERAAAV
jgi:hypothetical protein